MPTLQEYLNEKYPTKKDREKLKGITTDWEGLKITNQDGKSHLLTEEETKELDGKELNLSEYSNLERIIIHGFYLKSELTGLDVNNCSKLIELNCFNNQLTNLTITNCPNLKEINCSENQLTNLELNNLPVLTILNCSGNKLTNLNFLTNCWKSLTVLSIDNNELTDLTPLSQLVNCEILDLSSNPFTGSLAPLQNLSKLKTLWINDTQINSDLEYLPESLERFNCSGNNFTTLSLNHCKNLTDLNCSNNPLTTLFLFNGGEKITSLSLSANHLKDLSLFSKLVNLEELNLRDYSSTSSLEPLKNYQKLKKLNLKGNTNILPDWEYLHKIKEITFEDTKEDLKKKEIKEHRKELIPYQQKKESDGNIHYNLQLWRQNQPAYQNLQQALLKVNPNLDINEIINQFEFFNVKTGEFQGDLSNLTLLFTKTQEETYFLRKTIENLTKLIKTQKEKIVGAYTHFCSEKETLQELIKTHLEYSKAKKQKLPSVKLRKQRDKIRDELEEKLGEEQMEIVENIFADCDELVHAELELLAKTNIPLLIKFTKEGRINITYIGSVNNNVQMGNINIENSQFANSVAIGVGQVNQNLTKRTRRESWSWEENPAKESKITEIEAMEIDSSASSNLNWTNIHHSFNQSLINQWINSHFTYEQTQEWANAFGQAFNPQEIIFYIWLRDAKQLTAEQTLNQANLEQLRSEYQQNQLIAQIQLPPKS